MRIDEKTYMAMPSELRALFIKCPNPGSEEVVRLFPGEGDGSAARFFYCAKASKADRDEGCDALDEREAADFDHRPSGDFAKRMNRERAAVVRRNTHPTVKPTALMRYLCRLVTPPGGVVLDRFMGSGSTGRGAVLEGFGFIGIEREPEYLEIARARIAAAQGGCSVEPVRPADERGTEEPACDLFGWQEASG